MKTDMFGLYRWILAHPRKSVAGYFTINGRPLTHKEVVTVVEYACKHGYQTEEDIPDEELKALLKWDTK